ncbi:Abi family protein [Deinococcus sonorensis]|uniref:Abi family protein n=2 Tax=Deinococcus sonorensis TaxID=309891 RepID=A0AAU7UHJ4_9DEIO
MKPVYTKTPLTLPEQVQHLHSKGLLIPDVPHAERVLRRVGLYRFKGFLLPYKTSLGYRSGTSFADVERLMTVDAELQLHVLKAMQTVEVGVRQAIVQFMIERHGLRWYADSGHFHDPNEFFNHAEFLVKVTEEFDRMPELFVGHYRERYELGVPPPIWMIAETMTLGGWSKLFAALRSQEDKDGIAALLNVRASTFTSWLHALTVVRNVCAHQSRLYDRVFATMGIADNKRVRRTLLEHSFDPRDTEARRLAPRLYALHRLTRELDPGTSWTVQLMGIVANYGLAELPRLGFRAGWETQVEWN